MTEQTATGSRLSGYQRIFAIIAIFGLLANTAYIIGSGQPSFVDGQTSNIFYLIQLVLIVVAPASCYDFRGPDAWPRFLLPLGVSGAIMACHLTLLSSPDIALKCLSLPIGAVGFLIPLLDSKYGQLAPLLFPFRSVSNWLDRMFDTSRFYLPLAITIFFFVGVGAYSVPLGPELVSSGDSGLSGLILWFLLRWGFAILVPTTSIVVVLLCALCLATHLLSDDKEPGELFLNWPSGEWLIKTIRSPAGLIAIVVVPLAFASAPLVVGLLADTDALYASLLVMVFACVYFVSDCLAYRQRYLDRKRNILQRAEKIVPEFLTLREECDLSQLEDNVQAAVAGMEDPREDWVFDDLQEELAERMIALDTIEELVSSMRSATSMGTDCGIEAHAGPMSDLDAEIASTDSEEVDD